MSVREDVIVSRRSVGGAVVFMGAVLCAETAAEGDLTMIRPRDDGDEERRRVALNTGSMRDADAFGLIRSAIVIALGEVDTNGRLSAAFSDVLIVRVLAAFGEDASCVGDPPATACCGAPASGTLHERARGDDGVGLMVVLTGRVPLTSSEGRITLAFAAAT